MCDDVAVRWSEYETSRMQQETEIRAKISRELEKHIEEYRQNDFPNHYVMGMERARLLVLFSQSLKNSDPGLAAQQRLF